MQKKARARHGLQNCCDCNVEYEKSGNGNVRCPSCLLEHKRAQFRKNSAAYSLRKGLLKNPGIGRGGSNTSGEKDSQFKNGYSFFLRCRLKIKDERRYCEHCQKDLIDAGKYQWLIHHKDHNPNNNVYENFALLCKRCHQIEHECHKAFSSRATTIPQGSRD